MSTVGPFSERVLRRFVTFLAIALVTVGLYVTVVDPMFVASPPGDYELRHCDNRLSERDFAAAIAWCDKALEAESKHRGAMMGRAIALHQLGEREQAEAEYGALIAFLEASLAPDDPTGRGTLAAAYANRGILRDEAGQHVAALEDYDKALTIDAESVSGPDIFHKILHDPKPATVEKRASFLREQLALPPGERAPLTDPTGSSRQRMHKP